MDPPDLELDHVFYLTSELDRHTAALVDAGFAIEPGQRHPGQGTANRRVLFHRNYLELLFVDDLAASRQNPLRLHRRLAPEAARIGVVARGRFPRGFDDAFEPYEPPYAPGLTIWVHSRSLRDPRLPMFLVLDESTFGPREAMWPRTRFRAQPQWFAHGNGATDLVEVTAPMGADLAQLPLSAVRATAGRGSTLVVAAPTQFAVSLDEAVSITTSRSP
ncbi:MAG: VOC family protein [Planctomycetes bacterium]|nr:VOC family protein [Planctomycetota bacterium]